MKPTLVAILSLICVSSVLAQTPLPSTAYPAPIGGLAGRYLDSALTGDFQGGPVRTLRADQVKIAPEHDRIFMKLGGGVFVGYRLSTFAGQVASTPLIRMSRWVGTGELYQPWVMSVDPEGGGGWTTARIDGQEFLGGFDWDDRGIVYVAYSVWGFGLVDLSGELIKQVSEPAQHVGALKFNSQYYVVRSSGNAVTIYNVTTPTAPTFHRADTFGIKNYARVGSHFVILTTDAEIRFYRPEELLNGYTAAQSATSPGGFLDISTDGTSLFALIGGLVPSIAVFTPNGRGGFERKDFPLPSNVYPGDIEAGAGYVAVTGKRLLNGVLLRFAYLAKYVNGTMTPYDVSAWYNSSYPDSLGYTLEKQIVPVKIGGETYFLNAMHGIGDMFRAIPDTPIVAAPLVTVSGVVGSTMTGTATSAARINEVRYSLGGVSSGVTVATPVAVGTNVWTITLPQQLPSGKTIVTIKAIDEHGTEGSTSIEIFRGIFVKEKSTQSPPSFVTERDQ